MKQGYHVRLPVELLNRAKGLAALTDRTVTDMLTEGLSLVLESTEVDVESAIQSKMSALRKAAQDLKGVD
jgi:predicted DNA-binding protein